MAIDHSWDHSCVYTRIPTYILRVISYDKEHSSDYHKQFIV